MRIFGVVNMTRDSFSDGGVYLDVDDALTHARTLRADGAEVIDIGAESTNPDAEAVSAEEEIARLTPVVEQLLSEGATLSVDTHKPQVMQAMLDLGVQWINDVTGCRDPRTIAALAQSRCRVVLMHSTAARARADRKYVAAGEVMPAIRRFFVHQLEVLTAAGIKRERIVLDPGLGFFIGSNPEASLAVLRGLDQLHALGQPIMVAASRKSFIGALLESAEEPRPVAGRSAGTLAVELFAAAKGAEFVRTHDVRALHDALKLWERLDPVKRAFANA